MMTIDEVMQHLPHRFPFLLIDRVLEIKPKHSILAVKNVSVNEPFFVGHFPEKPVMPGVLLVEALAQAAGVLAFVSTGEKPSDGILYYLAGIDNTRFKRVVIPGDTIHLKVEAMRGKREIWKFSGVATVGDELACEAELICAKKRIS